jgi:hypothetical protein
MGLRQFEFDEIETSCAFVALTVLVFPKGK